MSNPPLPNMLCLPCMALPPQPPPPPHDIPHPPRPLRGGRSEVRGGSGVKGQRSSSAVGGPGPTRRPPPGPGHAAGPVPVGAAPRPPPSARRRRRRSPPSAAVTGGEPTWGAGEGGGQRPGVGGEGDGGALRRPGGVTGSPAALLWRRGKARRGRAGPGGRGGPRGPLGPMGVRPGRPSAPRGASWLPDPPHKHHHSVRNPSCVWGGIPVPVLRRWAAVSSSSPPPFSAGPLPGPRARPVPPPCLGPCRPPAATRLHPHGTRGLAAVPATCPAEGLGCGAAAGTAPLS